LPALIAILNFKPLRFLKTRKQLCMKKLLPCLLLLFAACKKDLQNSQVSAVNSTSNATTASGSLELVYSDSMYELTGVAVSKTGRMFTNYPLWNRPHKYDVAEITSTTQNRPYPDLPANSWNNGEDGLSKWVCVQSVYVDDEDKLWVVDPASPFMKGVYQHSYKLVKFDLATNKSERVYRFNYAADENSYINDVRVDTHLDYAYLTNSNEGGIFVVDLKTGNIRQVLQGHYSVIADPNYKFTINGKLFKQNGAPVKINSDGIALTPDGIYLYYKPLSDDRLYRIQTKYLRDENISAAELGSKVEYLGRYTTTDGMIFDPQGNLYLGDLENSRIIKITPDLQMHELVKSPLLDWPDSYAVANGYLYVSCSQLEKQPKYNTASPQWPPATPFTIYRIKL
jgi:sugar lactone lactonase YvrE